MRIYRAISVVALAIATVAFTSLALAMRGHIVNPQIATSWSITTEDKTLIIWSSAPYGFGSMAIEGEQCSVGMRTADMAGLPERGLPAWVTHPPHSGHPWENERWRAAGFGWPAIVLTDSWAYMRQGEKVWPKSLVPRWEFTLFETNYTLPMRVHWPGAILNFVVACLLWACLLAIPSIVRRFVRDRRGLCLKCGYDVRSTGGVICPECGTPAQGAGRNESPASSG